jgi:hypothetical protein
VGNGEESARRRGMCLCGLERKNQEETRRDYTLACGLRAAGCGRGEPSSIGQYEPKCKKKFIK